MNRGDLILSTVRLALRTDADFNVVKCHIEDAQPLRYDVYAYIQKDSLLLEEMEDGDTQDKIHYVEVGLAVRWFNKQDAANEGRGAATANLIVDKIERAVNDYSLSSATVTYNGRTHRVTQMDCVESLGYFDDKRQLGETFTTVTVTAVSS